MSETRVVNVLKEKPDVYIGRWTSAPLVRAKWGEVPGLDGDYGNPHALKRRCTVCSFNKGHIVIHTSLDEVLAAFEETFADQVHEPIIRSKVLLLEGKTLGCFCKPKPCHGDVYVRWLQSLKGG